ncbi:MAG: hypothetical protein QM749_19810 [Aquabacterium sp.]
MSNESVYEDQSKRNTLGFDITCQVSALLNMIKREQSKHEDLQSFNDLLNAVMPRLHDLNEAAMALFSDGNALTSSDLMVTIHGKQGATA